MHRLTTALKCFRKRFIWIGSSSHLFGKVLILLFNNNRLNLAKLLFFACTQWLSSSKTFFFVRPNVTNTKVSPGRFSAESGRKNVLMYAPPLVCLDDLVNVLEYLLGALLKSKRTEST